MVVGPNIKKINFKVVPFSFMRINFGYFDFEIKFIGGTILDFLGLGSYYNLLVDFETLVVPCYLITNYFQEI